MRSETIFFQGQAGKIECAIDFPSDTSESAIKGWLLCLHPHPLHEGNNMNKVVTTIARACVHQGFVALRPNFRGVGQSEGVFDRAEGETVDMLMLLNAFAQRYPAIAQKEWLLGGFSFGTAVAAQLYAELADQGKALPKQLMLFGSGVWRYSYRSIDLPKNTLLVHGEKDEVIPLSDVLDWLHDFNLPITVIPNACHFFHGKLVLLKQLIQEKLSIF